MSPCSSNFSIRLTSRYTATEKGGEDRRNHGRCENGNQAASLHYDLGAGMAMPATRESKMTRCSISAARSSRRIVTRNKNCSSVMMRLRLQMLTPVSSSPIFPNWSALGPTSASCFKSTMPAGHGPENLAVPDRWHPPRFPARPQPLSPCASSRASRRLRIRIPGGRRVSMGITDAYPKTCSTPFTGCT